MRYAVPVARKPPPPIHSTGTVSSCGSAPALSLCTHEREGSHQRVDSFFGESTGKERDSETGLYYYGARYLDGKTSRWLSADPALGDYVPGAPVDDEARKRNGNLPGMGGVFNTVNFHLYHYAGNNPVKYVDPDGRIVEDVGTNIYQQNSLDKNGEKINLGETNKTIYDVGCVLTSATRIASKISDQTISLETANNVAIRNDLYTVGADGIKNALTLDNQAKLIGLLTNCDIGAIRLEGDEAKLSNTINGLNKYPYASYYITGRMNATNSDASRTYAHTVNMGPPSIKRSGISLGHGYTFYNNNLVVRDSSNVGRTSTAGRVPGINEPISRIDVFFVRGR